MSELHPQSQGGGEAGQVLYENIFRSASVGILLFNENLEVVFVNDLVKLLTGYDPEELRGSQFFDIVIPDSRGAAYLQGLRKANSEPLELDINIQKQSGELMDLNVTSSAFHSENQNYVLLIIQNITNRKASEKVMEDSFDKFIQTTIDLDQALKKIREQSAELTSYKDKMENELEVAQLVQSAIIPEEFPASEYAEAFGICLPCNELGGDYLDVFELDHDRLGLLIADVSGHGVPSALITTMVKVYFTSLAREIPDPARLMSAVNAEMYKIFGGTGFYFTACYSVLNLRTHEIATVLGGHSAPYRYNPEIAGVTQLNAEAGTIVGAIPPQLASYETAITQLREGDTLLYYTDGIYEARAGAEDQELYGEDRLVAFMEKNRHVGPRALVKGLISDVDSYFQGHPPNDDRSVLAIRIGRKKEGSDPLPDLFRAARNAFESGKLKEALRKYNEILWLRPHSEQALFWAGLINLKMGQFQSSLKLLKEVVALNPQDFRANYHLGAAYFNLKQYGEALNVWNSLRERAGSYRKVDELIARAERKVRTVGLS
ncbi:MAG: SpoIIE family protein phosphatase [Leptospiraceae bacterium]|nr:SpoIIE family protein phosphatase [Leptospiraceae bacterium]